MLNMDGKVVLVTGASRGVARGIAAELSNLGGIVSATGRSILSANLPASVERIVCDHNVDDQVADVFARIERERGRLDVLVNGVWGGYERMVEDGEFTWLRPFWEQPRWRWDAMMNAGVRAAFIASQEAAKQMVLAKRGLIVNISSWSAQKHIGNVMYGVSKAATDKLTYDCALELREFGVAVVSLYPGLVRTESVLAAGVFDLSNSESPEYLGRAVAALANEPEPLARSGQVVVAAALGKELGFADIDGRVPRPLSLSEM
jgi:dehydrogenase/reductase SDR family member 1